MKSTNKLYKFIGIIIVFLLFIGLFAYINGWIPLSPKDTHPSCDQLPSISEASASLENNQDLVKEIQKLGNEITVEVGKPCKDDQDRGLIMITYGTNEEREKIGEFLSHLSEEDGFGVPVYLVKR
ncbi:hypothetical protein [Pallidibacillus thermolactis]|jgi:hypothetical protein|uniref:hypothetical protein n=1 Tax=Pallidibacillus thermolactis TaxID=251051 RepID=UPI00156BABCD|nr:hypothetical protein [Pallidibacillus thermolactis]MED1673677.1 hypothetical protein [Pallidibacillus thermolactis subsp. kokeshiiformis]